MPSFHFQSLSDSIARLPDVLRTIPDVIRQPASNPVEAAIVLGMGLIIVLVVMLSVALLVIRPPIELRTEAKSGAARTGAQKQQRTPFQWLTAASVVLLLVAALFIATGISTSSSQACESCHLNSPHAGAVAKDPHRSVSCVSCHEPGGTVGRVTANVVPRIAHIALGRIDPSAAVGYGRPISSDACLSCHRRQISVKVVDASTGVIVSHKEPLAAGAECVDCHTLKNGSVSKTIVGMSTCLRCHDGAKASATCSTCHRGDPAAAIAASLPARATLSQVLVPNPQCGSCHTDQSRCNSCHGMSLPHSQDFLLYGHARPGAIAIWTNNGQPCQRCHYTGHNDCQQAGCHTGPFPSHGISWMVGHQTASWSGSDSACSCHNWNSGLHNGVLFCQVCHATKPATAR